MKETQGLFKPFSRLDEFVLIFLKNYFKHHPEFPWTNDADKKISIVSAFSIYDEDDIFLPKLIVQNGPFSMTNFHFLSPTQGEGTLLDFSQERKQSYRIGTVYYLDILARLPKQAKDLAQELIVMFAMYADRISEKFGFVIEKTFDSSPPQTEYEGITIKKSVVRINLVCSYIYSITGRYLPMYPKLAEIDLLGNVDKDLQNLDLKKIKFI